MSDESICTIILVPFFITEEYSDDPDTESPDVGIALIGNASTRIARSRAGRVTICRRLTYGGNYDVD